MQKLLEKFKGGMVLGISFLLTIIIGGFIYANVGNIWKDPSDLEVNSGDLLTKDLWNATQSNVKNLGERVSILEGDPENITSYSIGEVMTNAVWIGGKPIYKRTFVRTFSNTGSVQETFDSSGNIALIIDQKITYDHTTWSVTGPIYYGSAGDELAYKMQVTSNGHNVSLWRNITNPAYLNGTFYITAYYTKIVD